MCVVAKLQIWIVKNALEAWKKEPPYRNYRGRIDDELLNDWGKVDIAKFEQTINRQESELERLLDENI